MKKNCVLLLSVILLVGMLAGCECEHQWMSADCLTPKTCEKCQAAEGEALGHDFAPSSCVVPETCTRCGVTRGDALAHDFLSANCSEPETCLLCGQTQGEPLGHSFGDWTVENDTMRHICHVCWEAETVPVDYNLIVARRLTGHWDFVEGMKDGQRIALNVEEGKLGAYLRFSGDQTGTLYRDETGEKSITWVFDHYEVVAEIPEYHFVITTEDQTEYTAVLSDNSAGEDVLILTAGENDMMILYSYPVLSSAIEGCMVSTDNGAVHVLHFYEDRIVTGDLNGREISGTWHLSPLYVSENGILYVNVMIRFAENGEVHTVSTQLNLDTGNRSLEEYLKSNRLSAYAYFWEGANSYGYDTMHESAAADLEAAWKESTAMLVGPWQSFRENTTIYDTAVTNERDFQGYSICFAEDGTFTALLDREYTGTWTFSSMNSAGGSSIYHIYRHYSLTFDGVQESVTASLAPKGELSFGYHKDSNSYTSFYFMHMTEEEITEREAIRIQAEKNITGTWTGYQFYLINKDGSEDSFYDRTDCSITFREDGTFVANLDREYTGTWSWEYPDFNAREGGGDLTQTNFYYTLDFDGVETGIKVTDCSVTIRDTTDIFSNDPNLDRHFFFQAEDENRVAVLHFIQADD